MRIAKIVVVSAFVAFGTACGGLEKVPEGDVDASQRDVAQRLGTRLWEGCASGRHQPLAESEAIDAMRKGLSPERMASTCASTRAQFGDFVSMEYAETWRVGSQRVYRFKGRFTNASTPPEIRVVMDGSKLSGFWLKPWSDKLQ